MNMIVSCLMGHGTFQAKFNPLVRAKGLDNIYVLRKTRGPEVEGIQYILLPKIARKWIFNLIITPFILARQARRVKASIIMSYHFTPHTVFVWLASIMTGIPYAISQTGLYVQRYAKQPLWGWLIRAIYRKATFLNVPGTQSKKFWTAQGVDPAKINVLHSTIDTDKFTPSDQEKDIDILFMGRFSPEKQIMLILDAVRRLLEGGHQINAAIVGYGPLEKELKNFVSEHGLEKFISFPGQQTDVLHWYRRSRIFVMASNSEGLPCALMEAMSCELSVVCPSVGNISDVLTDGETGYTMPLATDETIYQQLSRALENYDRDDAIRTNARRIIVDEHSYGFAIGKWNSVIADLRKKGL